METYYFVNDVLVIWVYTFVIIQPNVQLKCVYFIVFKLYLSKVDLKMVKNLDEQYFEINFVFVFVCLLIWENSL